MALEPLDPEVLEQSQAELKEALLGSVSPLANIGNIQGLVDGTEFEWPRDSGARYSIRRLPYSAGVKMEDLFIRIRESKKYPGALGMLPVYERQLREAIDLAWQVCRPASRWTRIRKRAGWIRNPFRNMSDGEIADVIAFFLIRRMTSTVKFRYPANRRLPTPSL